jgi:hypothetical protein
MRSEAIDFQYKNRFAECPNGMLGVFLSVEHSQDCSFVGFGLK